MLNVKEFTVKTSILRTFFSALSVMVILVTLLASVGPVFAANDGTAEYTVKKNETIKDIAARFGLTVESILLANPDIKDPNNIHAGQVIILPAGRSEGLIAAYKAGRIYVWQRERDGGRIEKTDRLYLVKNGDNLTKIAKSYGITLEKLLEVNPQIDDANKLYRGELVNIPYGLAEIVPPFYETPKPAPGESK